jgi:pimeloyl-ACP methyl ester carboxylesterase
MLEQRSPRRATPVREADLPAWWSRAVARVILPDWSTLARMEVPEIRYAKSGDFNIAYQRFGSGPDVVSIPPLISNVEIMWEHEVFRRFLELRADRTRVLHFDKRGVGMSDRVTQAPTLEERIGDILAVMDAEGVERAGILGVSEGALMAQHFAATHPERVDRLVLVNAVPGLAALAELPAYSDEPLPPLEEVLGRFIRLIETWGREPEYMAEWFIPSQCRSASFLRWLGRFQRQSASPADLQRQIENVATLSIPKERLTEIRAKTLVMHVKGDRVQPVAVGRYLAAHIPGAELMEIDGADHFCFTMPNWDDLVTRLNDFFTGVNTPMTAQGAEPPSRGTEQPLTKLRSLHERHATLRRQGAVWMLSFRGRTAGLAHVRGLSDLQYLLLHPHLDAAAAEQAASRTLRDDGLNIGIDRGDAGEILDDRARRAYYNHLRELRADLEEAERDNDLGRAERLRAELDVIESELRSAVGLGGRARRAASGSERLRVAVSKRIRLAVERIANACPELGDHLRKSIRTGMHCAYVPTPSEEIDWIA